KDHRFLSRNDLVLQSRKIHVGNRPFLFPFMKFKTENQSWKWNVFNHRFMVESLAALRRYFDENEPPRFGQLNVVERASRQYGCPNHTRFERLQDRISDCLMRIDALAHFYAVSVLLHDGKRKMVADPNDHFVSG